MAVGFAVRDGIRDAREARPAYFWALFTEPGHCRERLQAGWKSVGRVFIFACVLDAIYQFITVRWFYPMETLVVAVLLAIVPYVLMRGPVNRIAVWYGKTHERHAQGIHAKARH
jgi:hypothetical protein